MFEDIFCVIIIILNAILLIEVVKDAKKIRKIERKVKEEQKTKEKLRK